MSSSGCTVQILNEAASDEYVFSSSGRVLIFGLLFLICRLVHHQPAKAFRDFSFFK